MRAEPAALPAPDAALADQLFAQLREIGFDGVGITRDAYGRGEQRAHGLIAETGKRLGLEIRRDAALNLYVTLPGRDRTAPAALTGSHLDSVPRGGNFDGAAGVVAGMAVLSGWVAAGYTPPADVTVMGIRAEESTWFPYSYLGSKSAFGLVGPEALALARADTGRPLSAHIADCGGDPARHGEPGLTPAQVGCFVELHIEQAPMLIEAGLPVGLVTGIRGSLRYRDARILGETAHSGAVPRRSRRDAVSAAAELVYLSNQAWARMEDEGQDLVVTFGQLGTDPAEHAFSKIAGQVDFCIDVRSLSTATLESFDRQFQQLAADVAARHGVKIELGAMTGSLPALMDEGLQQRLARAARALDIPAQAMASGAGHDAAVFAQQGIPTAMIFVRNAFGSHNPQEAMDMADFLPATRLLGELLAGR